jgi:hypothetical protein
VNPVKSPYILLTFILLLVSLTQSYAYFEVLKLNTTVTLSTNTSGKVVEVLTLFVSNSSIQQYKADRAALNLSLNNWNSELGTTLLTPHILNPRSSISNFTFLPGPVLIVGTSGGEATLTMSYIANNITYIKPIGPRRFEYFFNSSALNFEHTASGEQLFSNARLNMIIPNSASILSVYPSPDYPTPNLNGQYGNATMFSWYYSETLSKFVFNYVVTESLQAEVTNYFTNLYEKYSGIIYAVVIIAVALLVFYIYKKVS